MVDNIIFCIDDYVMFNDDCFCREYLNGGYYVIVGRDVKIIFRLLFSVNIKYSGFNLFIEVIGK